MQQAGGGPTLRPLGVGEILDVAIKIYTRNLGTFLAIVALIYIPLGVIAVLGFASALPEGSRVRNGMIEFPITQSDTGFVVFVLIFAVIAWLATFLATGAGVKAVAEAYVGRKPTVGGSYSYVARRLHSVMWVVLLFAIIVGLGTVLLVIPGIYLAVALSLAVPALVVEGTKGTKALRRSHGLVKGRWWATFGALLLGFILIPVVIQYAFTFVLQLGLGAVEMTSTTAVLALSQAVGTLGQIIATPIQIAVLTIIYFDLRVRKEAFDLQLLTDRIGSGPAELQGSGDPSGTTPTAAG
jgi:hypothetical protein